MRLYIGRISVFNGRYWIPGAEQQIAATNFHTAVSRMSKEGISALRKSRPGRLTIKRIEVCLKDCGKVESVVNRGNETQEGGEDRAEPVNPARTK